MLEVSAFFREDLVKLCEQELSLVCYHYRRGCAGVPFPFFTRCQRIVLKQIVEMDSIPKRKKNGVPHFTEDNIQRIVINPFYAITVAPQLTQEHEPSMGEAEWVQANASLMREMGCELWLRQLLDMLNGDMVTAGEVGLVPPGARSVTARPADLHRGGGEKRNGKRGATSKASASLLGTAIAIRRNIR
jgi:hypothetical protein